MSTPSRILEFQFGDCESRRDENSNIFMDKIPDWNEGALWFFINQNLSPREPFQILSNLFTWVHKIQKGEVKLGSPEGPTTFEDMTHLVVLFSYPNSALRMYTSAFIGNLFGVK